jgi:hypothetical protein
VQCTHAVLKRVVFVDGEDELAEGEEPLSVALERQISCFADNDECYNPSLGGTR